MLGERTPLALAANQLPRLISAPRLP